MQNLTVKWSVISERFAAYTDGGTFVAFVGSTDAHAERAAEELGCALVYRDGTRREAPRPEHRRDEDCDVDEDGFCRGCGVAHWETCGTCGGRGFHRSETCPELDETAVPR